MYKLAIVGDDRIILKSEAVLQNTRVILQSGPSFIKFTSFILVKELYYRP
jgi:hypothetical protein